MGLFLIGSDFNPYNNCFTDEETGSNLETCFGLQMLILVLSISIDLCKDPKPYFDSLWEAT